MRSCLRAVGTSTHHGEAVPEVTTELLHDLPDLALSGRVVGRKSKGGDVTVMLEDLGLVLKCRPFVSRWTRHSVRGEFRVGRELGQVIPVAEPLAWLEPRAPGEGQTSYMVLRLIPEARKMRDLLGRDEVDRTKLLDALGRLIGRFHDAGWTHGDLTLKNVLIAADRPHLIDLDHAVRLPPWLRLAGRLHDLRTVRVSGRVVLGRMECTGWMQSYANERGLSRFSWRLHLGLIYLAPKRRRPLRRAARALHTLLRSSKDSITPASPVLPSSRLWRSSRAQAREPLDAAIQLDVDAMEDR